MFMLLTQKHTSRSQRYKSMKMAFFGCAIVYVIGINENQSLELIYMDLE